MWTEPKQIQKKGVHLHIYNFSQKEIRKYFKLVSRMQHTWKTDIATLDFLTSLSLDMHILAITQHAHKAHDQMYWMCAIHPLLMKHIHHLRQTHTYNHTHLSFYLWALPGTLLRCIRLSALQIRDRLLRVKCHVCTNQIPGLGGDAENDGEGDERRKRRRNMVIHLLVSREGLIPLLQTTDSHPLIQRQQTAWMSVSKRNWQNLKVKLKWKRAESAEVSG